MSASTPPPSPDPTLKERAELKQDFPGWNIIFSAEGRWWAQRFPVPREAFDQPNMVDADSAEGLRAKLAEATS